MSYCVSCHTPKVITYRKMCATCATDYRYTRYRKWIEKRSIKLGKPIPQYGERKNK